MKEKQNKVLLFIIVAVVLIGMVYTGYWLAIKLSQGKVPKQNIMLFINYIGILYYILIGYKKPHGNLLRYLFLLYAVNLALDGIIRSDQVIIIAVLFVLAAMIITFIAGRLYKAKQNAVLGVIVFILIIAGIINMNVLGKNQSLFETIKRNAPIFIQWIILMITYYVRFKAHKEAGLIDSSEKNIRLTP